MIGKKTSAYIVAGDLVSGEYDFDRRVRSESYLSNEDRCGRTRAVRSAFNADVEILKCGLRSTAGGTGTYLLALGVTEQMTLLVPT